MSLPLHQKIYWKIRNPLEYAYNKLLNRGSGVLGHRQDGRDIEFPIGVFGAKKTAFQNYSLDTNVRINQTPFNWCIYASRVQGRSMQDGIRWSGRWHVKNARRLGFINGDGWSHLRGGNEVGYKVGYLPYVLMPDEINGMSWDEYSRWTLEDEKLLEVAGQFRPTAYYAIKNQAQAIEAVEGGHVLFTAGKWYRDMNYPIAPYYLLLPLKEYVGGHAYGISGYRNYGSHWQAPQTFGEHYGDKGIAWLMSLFGPGQYAIYTEEHLPLQTKIDYYCTYHADQPLKGSGPAIYLIQQGEKRAFTGWEQYLAWCDIHHMSSNSFILVRDNILDAIPTGSNLV